MTHRDRTAAAAAAVGSLGGGTPVAVVVAGVTDTAEVAEVVILDSTMSQGRYLDGTGGPDAAVVYGFPKFLLHCCSVGEEDWGPDSCSVVSS